MAFWMPGARFVPSWAGGESARAKTLRGAPVSYLRGALVRHRRGALVSHRRGALVSHPWGAQRRRGAATRLDHHVGKRFQANLAGAQKDIVGVNERNDLGTILDLYAKCQAFEEMPRTIYRQAAAACAAVAQKGKEGQLGEEGVMNTFDSVRAITSNTPLLALTQRQEALVA